MIRQATIENIPQIYPLISIIWKDMNFPLLTYLSPNQFKQLMYQLMANINFKFYIGNCFVYIEDDIIKGILYHYDGDKEENYNQFLEQIMQKLYPDFDVTLLHYGLESKVNEHYIDSLVVHHHYQNQKIGTKLLLHLCHQNKQLLSLNCEIDNLSAKRLYERLGFEIDQTIQFLNHNYWHMIRRNK